MRQVSIVIKGMNVLDAIDSLNFITRKSASFILKTLNSAIANAENNFSLKKENLFIKEIMVDDGVTLKRWRARAFGRAAPIRKRSSHLTIILNQVKEEKIKKKVQKLAEPSIKKIAKSGEPVSVPREKQSKLTDMDKDKQAKHEEIFDSRMKGKHRSKQHVDNVTQKQSGGRLSRIFRRKSI